MADTAIKIVMILNGKCPKAAKMRQEKQRRRKSLELLLGIGGKAEHLRRIYMESIFYAKHLPNKVEMGGADDIELLRLRSVYTDGQKIRSISLRHVA